MKGAFYKTQGQGQLSWDELIEVLLDIEIVLNNRPLRYAEDDIQLPTLTPNALLFIKSNIFARTAVVSSERKGPPSKK